MKKLLIFKDFFPYFFLTFIFFLIFQFIEWEKLLSTINNSNYNFLIPGFVLTIFWPLIASQRWSYTLRGFDLKVSYLRILRSIMISFSTNIFAPAKLGDFLKMFVMGKKLKKIDLASAVISERIGDLIVLLILSIIGSMYIQNLLYIFLSTFSFLSLILSIFLIGNIAITNLNSNFKKIIYVASKSTNSWLINFSKMKKALVFSLLIWFLACFQIYLFFYAFGINISFFTILAIFPLTVLVTLIPITPGGVGVREASFMILFNPYVDLHTSIAVSLCYYICTTCITSGIGAIYIFFFK